MKGRPPAPCVPARTRRTLRWPEGDSLCARTHAAPLGVSRRGFRACPLARGARLVFSEGASVRARSHAALLGAGRGGLPRVRSHATHSGVARRSFSVCPRRVPKGSPRAPARTRCPWARFETAVEQVNTEPFWCDPEVTICVPAPHAAHSGVSRRVVRARPHARGAPARARCPWARPESAVDQVNAEPFWCGPKVISGVPARTRRTMTPEMSSVRDRTRAAHSGVSRRCFPLPHTYAHTRTHTHTHTHPFTLPPLLSP